MTINKEMLKEKTSKVFDKTKSVVSDTSKNVVAKTTEMSKKVGKGVKESKDKVVEKVKTTITEQQVQEILSTLYIKSVDGIPKVSLPVDDLVRDYIEKNEDIESAAKSLINVSTVKCGTSGFVTSFGGFASMIATLPANITSVMYVQLRMCVAIAKMAGYDVHSDQVQTLVYVCLTGSAAADVLKQAGIKFGNKFGTTLVKKIPGKTITLINQKVGFRFVTKFGEKGIVNLGKIVPVLGGFIGGGIDVASTQTIGRNAYNIFIKGQMPDEKEEKNNIEKITEAEYEELDDLDSKTLKKAIKEEND